MRSFQWLFLFLLAFLHLPAYAGAEDSKPAEVVLDSEANERVCAPAPASAPAPRRAAAPKPKPAPAPVVCQQGEPGEPGPPGEKGDPGAPGVPGKDADTRFLSIVAGVGTVVSRQPVVHPVGTAEKPAFQYGDENLAEGVITAQLRLGCHRQGTFGVAPTFITGYSLPNGLYNHVIGGGTEICWRPTRHLQTGLVAMFESHTLDIDAFNTRGARVLTGSGGLAVSYWPWHFAAVRLTARGGYGQANYLGYWNARQRYSNLSLTGSAEIVFAISGPGLAPAD